MVGEYGTDDVDYLLTTSEKKNCFTIVREGKKHFVRVGRFDNREDMTSSFRKPQKDWTEEEISRMHSGMKKAFDALLGQ